MKCLSIFSKKTSRKIRKVNSIDVETEKEEAQEDREKMSEFARNFILDAIETGYQNGRKFIEIRLTEETVRKEVELRSRNYDFYSRYFFMAISPVFKEFNRPNTSEYPKEERFLTNGNSYDGLYYRLAIYPQGFSY